MYIDSNDIKGRALNEKDLATVSGGKNEDITTAIKDAEEYIRDTLKHRYNIDEELSKTGDDRKRTLVSVAVWLTVGNLCKSEILRSAPDVWGANYEEAKKTLEQIEKGKILTDLPALGEGIESQGGIKHGSSSNFLVSY